MLRSRKQKSKILKKLAELHQATGELPTAKDSAHRALTIATQLNIPLTADCQTLRESLNSPPTADP